MKSNKSVCRKAALLYLLLFLHGFHGFAQETPYYFPLRHGQQNYLAGTMGELRSSHFHGGIDIKTSGVTGLPVYAAADGYISRIKVSGVGYGNALYIAHPQLGTTTVYGHLKKYMPEIAALVRQEQYRRKTFEVELFPEKNQFKVKKGEQIAFSGNSGGSTGPHLHFEIRDGYQRPLNPLDQHFKEIKDNIPPTIQGIALKTLNIDSRVDGQFGVFHFNPVRSGQNYKITKPIEASGEIGILLHGYDRLNGVSNRNGIPHITVKLDGEEILKTDIIQIPFAKNREIFDYYNYRIKQASGATYQKLYIDDGNDLKIYPVAINRGKIEIADTLTHHVEITLADAYKNTTVLNFVLKGEKPGPKVVSGARDFHPDQNKVQGNTLMFMGHREANNGYFARVFANRMEYELSTSYYVNDYAVYLWDTAQRPARFHRHLRQENLPQGGNDGAFRCGIQIFPAQA